MSFKDLKVRGLGLSGGSLDAYLNIYNPNGFNLDATRLTYNVAVGEKPPVNALFVYNANPASMRATFKACEPMARMPRDRPARISASQTSSAASGSIHNS